MSSSVLTFLLAKVSAIICRYGPIRIVHVHGFFNSIYWNARSWLWNYPVTPDFGLWDEGDPADMENWMKNRKRVLRTWHFLQPFFATRGHTLYVHEDPAAFCSPLIPQTKPIKIGEETGFPFARYCCKDDKELSFLFIWKRCDNQGSIWSNPNEGTASLHSLHSPPLCNNPLNRTIPILEYIKFNQQVFAIMPRWSRASCGDFVVVHELIRYGQAFFEAVAFLHESGIAHGDVLPQNMPMDIIVPSDKHLAGLRGPERRYALIDFETAILPAVDDGSSSSSQVEEMLRRNVHLLAVTLELNLRCIGHIVPRLDELLNSMKNSDSPSQPKAAVALARDEEICSVLGEEELQLPVQAIRWVKGEIKYRSGPPIYPED